MIKTVLVLPTSVVRLVVGLPTRSSAPPVDEERTRSGPLPSHGVPNGGHLLLLEELPHLMDADLDRAAFFVERLVNGESDEADEVY